MEKLRELLNEFDPYIAKDGEHRDNLWYTVYDNGSAIFSKGIGILVIMSKEYGFIKRLVENDKIDFEKVKDNSELYIKFSCNDSEKLAFSKIILMLLSISDTPIEDLISYLK